MLDRSFFVSVLMFVVNLQASGDLQKLRDAKEVGEV